MTALLWFMSGAAVVLVVLWVLDRRMGFRAQRSEDYAAKGPAFDVRAHLNGPIQCEGVIFGPAGRVTSRFVAHMHGQWSGNEGRLTEAFCYDTGTSQDRYWNLQLHGDGRIEAEAPDIVGRGRGRQSGAAVHLRYRLRLPQQAGGHVLDVTDWMYLTENGVIINRSQFRKFGIKVAELVATMRRVP